MVTYDLFDMVSYNLSYRGSVVSDRGRSSMVGNRSRGSMVVDGGGSGVVSNGSSHGQLGDRRRGKKLGLIMVHETLGRHGGGGVVWIGQETCLGDGHQRTQNYALKNNKDFNKVVL